MEESDVHARSISEPVPTDAPPSLEEMARGLSANPKPIPSFEVAPPPPTPPAEPEHPVHKNSSWGTMIAILLILIMMIVGAFYAWGKRIAEQSASAPPVGAVNA